MYSHGQGGPIPQQAYAPTGIASIEAEQNHSAILTHAGRQGRNAADVKVRGNENKEVKMSKSKSNSVSKFAGVFP